MKPTNGANLTALRRIVERRNETLPGGGLWRAFDLLITLLGVVVFALAVRGVLAEPVRVDGTSMLDTLQHNDYLFVEKLSYLFSTPKIGDVVICYYPDEYYTANAKSYNTRVKRVVATPGDTVQTIDGLVYVNGKPLEEGYLAPFAYGRTNGIEKPITVGENEVYVLGDNRVNSNDSRNVLVGAIPMERIVGKVHFVLFPFSHFHGVTSWK